MDNIEDQEKTILKAIDNYVLYTKSERETLAALYKLSVDYTTVIPVTNLAKLIGYSRFSIYKNIKQLEKDGVIKTLKGLNKSLNYFEINQNKVQSIVDRYKKREKFNLSY